MKSIYTFSKKIKDTKIENKEIFDQKNIIKIIEILTKLENLPCVSISKFDDLGLMTNPKRWICQLIQPVNNENFEDMRSLLYDFTDTMMTRMREESKYALGLILESKIILCHSVYGEETITPEWKIIPRMLDTDNILRFATFTIEKGEIIVRFWEKEATNSFMEWLGLSRKKAFLFGGKYRICAEIENYRIEFQLTDEEIDEIIANHPEFKKGKLSLKNQLQYLNIDEIKISRKNYQNTEDFIQDFNAEKYGVPKYQKKYLKIKESSLPLLMRYVDDKFQVLRIEGDELEVEIVKDSSPFDIIFADADIKLRPTYSNELTRKFINGEKIKIFHAGLKFKSDPFPFGNLEIYNQLAVDELSKKFIEYNNAVNLHDNFLNKIFKYIGLKLLERANSENAINYLFAELSTNIISELSVQGLITSNENNIIEYKSRDYFTGSNEEISNRFIDDINIKIKNSDLKMYIIGVEDNGSLCPIISSRLQSDRIESIRKKINNSFNNYSINLFPIIINKDAVLILLVNKLQY